MAGGQQGSLLLPCGCLADGPDERASEASRFRELRRGQIPWLVLEVRAALEAPLFDG